MKFKNVACYRYTLYNLIFSLFCKVTLRKHYIIKTTLSVIQKICIQWNNNLKKFFFCFKNKRSKFEVEKVAIWQYFSISSKHRHTLFLILVFCPSQIKKLHYNRAGQQFCFMHLVRGWHFLCRKEITIRSFSLILSFRDYNHFISRQLHSVHMMSWRM